MLLKDVLQLSDVVVQVLTLIYKYNLPLHAITVHRPSTYSMGNTNTQTVLYSPFYVPLFKCTLCVQTHVFIGSSRRKHTVYQTTTKKKYHSTILPRVYNTSEVTKDSGTPMKTICQLPMLYAARLKYKNVRISQARVL